mmetsp:Transcript_59928/g.82005  ORF Transcript_59928/g.82005 Transcript_59928/m.82005 type:complete len:539 (-) Transcript_59928:329-1945(-)
MRQLLLEEEKKEKDVRLSFFDSRSDGIGAKVAQLLGSLGSKGARRKPKIAKGARDFLPGQMKVRQQALTSIRQVFDEHGAVEIDTPVFELKETLTGKYGEDTKLIYDLADQGGELLALRYDLTVPFARFLAMHSVGNIKRFHIAKVYRRDNPQLARGRYREFYQCDFDIAGTYLPMVADAEVITVATEILSTLPIGSFVVKLNHRVLLDSIFDISGVPADKFRTICSAVDKLDKEPWSEVKREMVEDKGLAEEVADKIGTFVTRLGAPRELHSILVKEKVFGDHPGAAEAMASLALLWDYLEAMGSLDYVSFDLSLARGLDYYTGVIYECVFTGGGPAVGSIAAGGRYDKLVGMFNENGQQVPCVGVSIGVERVFAIMESKALAEQCSVNCFVASVGKGMLLERMKLAKLLWADGISAEFFQNKENPNMKAQLEHALTKRIPIMLVIGESEVADGVTKVKELAKSTEATVQRGDVTQYIKQLLPGASSSSSSSAAPISLNQTQQTKQPRQTSSKPVSSNSSLGLSQTPKFAVLEVSPS